MIKHLWPKQRVLYTEDLKASVRLPPGMLILAKALSRESDARFTRIYQPNWSFGGISCSGLACFLETLGPSFILLAIWKCTHIYMQMPEKSLKNVWFWFERVLCLLKDEENIKGPRFFSLPNGWFSRFVFTQISPNMARKNVQLERHLQPPLLANNTM